MRRRGSSFNTTRVDYIYDNPHKRGTPFNLHYGDLSGKSHPTRLIRDIKPDEIYNLGVQSHVAVSLEA